ncbi:hypothetical protein PMAYCL1PPCAC_27501, partial [Pristionchus mayeri]
LTPPNSASRRESRRVTSLAISASLLIAASILTESHSRITCPNVSASRTASSSESSECFSSASLHLCTSTLLPSLNASSITSSSLSSSLSSS